MIWLVLQAAGITIVLSKGSIFEWFRERGPALWQELAECPLCVGVWVGAALASAQPGAWTALRALETLGTGCVTGVVALVAWRLVEALGAFSECQEAMTGQVDQLVDGGSAATSAVANDNKGGTVQELPSRLRTPPPPGPA